MPPHGHEPALRHGFLDLGVDLGPVFLDPGELLRLRHREDELRLVLQQRCHVGRRTGDLADRLTQRPQPRRVDVGVPDRADAVRRRGRGGRQHVGELLPGRGGRTVHVLEVDRVEGTADRAQDLPAPGAVDGQLRHQLPEHLQVLDELPHGLVEDREIHPGQGVLRLTARGLLVAQLRLQEGVVVEDHRVRRGLDMQQHLLAARDGRSDPYPLVARVEALHRGAVGPVDEALALEPGHVLVEAEIEDRLDRTARPLLGDGPGDPEPAGAPGRAPPVAGLDRPRRAA